MAQVCKKETPDVATWELVCFCLYNQDEKKELLGNPRLPMRTIDEMFLCRAILGKLFLTSDDCNDLKRRLRLSGFSDDLNTLQILPYSKANVQEAFERAQRSLKPSYNHEEKNVNNKWYQNNSFSVEVLMMMTENSMNNRVRRKCPVTRSRLPDYDLTANTDVDDILEDVDELEPPPKKRKPSDILHPVGDVNYSSLWSFSQTLSYLGNQARTGILQNSPNGNVQASSLCATNNVMTAGTATAPNSSVPVTPLRSDGGSFHSVPMDTLPVRRLNPITIDMSQSHDADDDKAEEPVLEEQKPQAVRIPYSQPDEEVELPVDANEPSSDPISLMVNNDNLLHSSDKEEESSIAIQTREEEETAMTHYEVKDDSSKKSFPSIVITLGVWLIGFHLLLWALLILDNAGIWGDQYNPLRICFSIETTSRPKLYPMGPMDLGTFSDPHHHGSWLEREDTMSGMMVMMTNQGMYLHRQCSPWYGAVSLALGLLVVMWILSKGIKRQMV